MRNEQVHIMWIGAGSPGLARMVTEGSGDLGSERSNQHYPISNTGALELGRVPVQPFHGLSVYNHLSVDFFPEIA